MTVATQELLRICEQLPEMQQVAVADFARSLLGQSSAVGKDEATRDAMLEHDVAAIRRAMEEVEQGKSRDAGQFFDELEARLLAMKAEQRRTAV